MHTGTVVAWQWTTGFIRPDGGGKDYFCHFSGIKESEGYRKLDVGQRVVFDVEQGPKGLPQACNVKVIVPGEVNGNVA